MMQVIIYTGSGIAMQSYSMGTCSVPPLRYKQLQMLELVASIMVILANAKVH